MTSTSTEATGGDTAQTVDTFDVTVNAVADAPTVTANDVSGNEDTAITLDIASALTDTDGSESLSIVVSGVPTGGSLSAGTDNGDGTWTLTQGQLTGLTLTPPSDSDSDFTLTVTSTSTEATGGDTAQTVDTFDVTVNAVADAPTVTANDVSGNEDAAITLDITSALTDTDGSESLSVVVSGVPSGASLSAGTDNGDGTWTLTQAQLTGLTLTPPSGSDDDFTLTVTSTSTEDNGGDTAQTVDTFDVTVNAANDAPVADASLASMELGSPITGTLSASDTEDSANALSYAVDTAPANGQVTVNADGSYSYTPSFGFTGSDSFTFTVTDTDGATDTATVTIDVLDRNLAVESGAEIRVNTSTEGGQIRSDTTVLTDGSFVIVWQNDGTSDDELGQVVGQRYDTDGNALGEEFVIGSFAGQMGGAIFEPQVEALAGGGFTVVWSEPQGNGQPYDTMARIYDTDGTPTTSEITVNTTASNSSSDSDPAIAGTSDGGFVVVWDGSESGDSTGIFAQRVDAAGTKVGSEFLVNTSTSGTQVDPSVAELDDGGFVVTWESSIGDGSGYSVVAQRFDSNGNAVGNEFQVNTTTASSQDNPSVTGLTGGGFVITWESSGQDDSGNGVCGQIYDSNGDAVGGEIQLNTYTTGNQDDVNVTALTDGGFFAVWNSMDQDGNRYGVYGQRFDSSGNSVGDELLINDTTLGDQDEPDVAVLNDGTIVVTWESHNVDGSSAAIMSKFIASASTGPHEMSGGDGNDSFIGGDQADSISGGAGDDLLEGGAGADTLDGDAGSDTASYANSSAGVTINLGDETASGGDAEGDELRNIENLVGSDFDDVLTGDDGANVLGLAPHLHIRCGNVPPTVEIRSAGIAG